MQEAICDSSQILKGDHFLLTSVQHKVFKARGCAVPPGPAETLILWITIKWKLGGSPLC